MFTRNPLRDMKKPRECCEKIITAEERQRIVAAVKDEAFTRFLYALGETGARPGEIRTVTAAHVKSSANAETLYWELEGKSTDRTGDSRCIYLTPVHGLAPSRGRLRYCEGPVVPQHAGRALDLNRRRVRIRFRNLRKKLGACRGRRRLRLPPHLHHRRALEKGVPIASLAELAGHKDTRMISTVYSKLSQKRQHLADMAAKAAEESNPQSRIEP